LRAVLDGDVVAANAYNAVQELMLRLPEWEKSWLGERAKTAVHVPTGADSPDA